MILSVIKFAEQCGVSRQAIYKAIKNGAITTTPDGKINTETRDALEYSAERTKNDVQISADPVSIKDKRSYDMERSKQGAIRLALQNQKMKGALIARADVERFIINPINTAHTRALTDGARSISALVQPMVMGGATVEEVEGVIKKQLSSFFHAAKVAAEDLLVQEK